MFDKEKKMKKLILHIGVHKTGSTAIQIFLFENNEILNQQGFYMPDFLYGSEHKPAELRYSIILKNEKKTRRFLNKIVKNAKRKSCDTVIISDEDYCKANEHNLSNVSIFGEFFEQIEILIYCRRPDRQSESGYAFCVMWESLKYSDSPERWYEDNFGKNYLFIADFYQKNIPNCKIIPVSYDFNSDRLINSFIEVCKIPETSYIMPKKSKSNISANKYMIEVMNEINKYDLNDKLFLEIKNYVLSHKQLQNGPKAIFFAHEQRIKNQQKVEEYNKKFIDKYNNGKPIFEEFALIDVPQGLSNDRKNVIVKEIVKRYNLKDKKQSEAIIRFTEKLQIPHSIITSDIFRELALLCEEVHLFDTAYSLVKLAQINSSEASIKQKKLIEIKGKAVASEKKTEDIYYIIELVDNTFKKFNTIGYMSDRMRQKFMISNKFHTFEILREIALFCEWYGQIPAALYFMTLAKWEKPNRAKLITEKCDSYRHILYPNRSGTRPKVFLHMGANKTASTSIQCSMAINRNVLRQYKDGYLFPKSWNPNCTKAFKYLCRDNFNFTIDYLRNKNIGSNTTSIYDNKRIESIIKEIEEFDGENYIFSGEDLHTLIYINMHRVKELINLLLPECKINVIFVVRDFVPFINSYVQQAAKAGQKLDAILKYLLQKKGFFKKAIINMRKVFGEENVIVYSFEESLMHKCGPVGFFLDKVGIDKDTINSMNIVRKNESLSNKATLLLLWINEILSIDGSVVMNDKKRRKILLKKLYAISGGGKFELNNKTIKQFYPYMQSEANWIKTKYGIDYTKVKKEYKATSVFDDIFEKEVMQLFGDLNEEIKHAAYVCFKKKSKSVRLDSVSRSSFKSLTRWCEINYPEIVKRNRLRKPNE